MNLNFEISKLPQINDFERYGHTEKNCFILWRLWKFCPILFNITFRYIALFIYTYKFMDYAYKLKLIMRIATKVMLFHCTVKALLWARNRIFDIQQTTTNRLQHFCWCCRVIQSSRLKLLYSKKLMCVSPFIFLKIIQRHKHILANFFDICIWCFSNLGNFFRRLYLDY